MRRLAVLGCLLHFAIVTLTCGAPLCVRANGTMRYEWGKDDCCGPVAGPCGTAERSEECCANCGDEGLPEISAAPLCGGCHNSLQPLPGGISIQLVQAFPAPEPVLIDFEAVFTGAEQAVVSQPSPPPLPASLPLRC